MQSGDSIKVTKGQHTIEMKLETVMRGLVVVSLPQVGVMGVDLHDGTLRPLPPPRGVCSVDIQTGRVIGTCASVASDLLVRLEALEVGEIVPLDNCATAEVVDVLLSEGTVKIYVPHSDELAQRKSGVWLVGWRVSDATLAALRESAGVRHRATG